VILLDIIRIYLMTSPKKSLEVETDSTLFADLAHVEVAAIPS
jgi:hypothetical protein